MTETIEQIREMDEDYNAYRERFKKSGFDLATFDSMKSDFNAFTKNRLDVVKQFYIDMKTSQEKTQAYLHGRGTPGSKDYVRGKLNSQLVPVLDDLANIYEAELLISNKVIANQAMLLDLQNDALIKLFMLAEEGVKKGWTAQFTRQQYSKMEQEMGGIRDSVKKLTDMLERMKPAGVDSAPENKDGASKILHPSNITEAPTKPKRSGYSEAGLMARVAKIRKEAGLDE